MASVSKNVRVQEPFLSDSANRSVNCSENLDGIIPFEFNSDGRLFISPTDALGYQFSVTSLNTPSMASSIQNIYPPRETLDNSSPYSAAKSTENGPITASRPCSSTSDALPFSLQANVLQDNSTVHAKTQDISPSLSSPIISNSHNAAEASNSAKLSADTHSEQPRSSYSLQEAYSLVGAGLANLGNTCFMNSILQCMTHTTLLVQALRTADHLQICQYMIGGDKRFCLFCALHDHIELSLSSSGGVVLPHKLVDNLSCISSYFVKLQQEDAHEFLQCLLDKLGEPCLFLMENKRSLACESDDLVKKIFGGCLVSKIRCCNCGHLSDRIEPLTDLSLEIENVDSLSGALESFTIVEKIDDPEMRFTCENCREVVSIEKRLMLDQVPSVATFHLKRFKSAGIAVEKINKPVKFPLELDLKPYTWSARDSNVELCYELYAVVEHVGEASTSGHYISYVRPSPDSWFRFDDSKVTLVPEDYVLSQEAYILFYAKKGTPWVCNLMEEHKGNNASMALPMSVPDGSCRGEPTIGNGNVDESTEFECIVPSQSSSHPLSTHPSGAVEEFDDNSGKNGSKSGNEENEEHGKVDDRRDMDCFHTLTPSGSPDPDTVTLEPQGHCIPRARAKPEKHGNAERPRKKVGESREKREAEGPLKKAMENSEKREALRYAQRSMPSARGMRLVAAMLEYPGEGSSGKAKKRMRASPCKKSSGSPNTRRKLPQNSVAARFVAAGN